MIHYVQDDLLNVPAEFFVIPCTWSAKCSNHALERNARRKFPQSCSWFVKSCREGKVHPGVPFEQVMIDLPHCDDEEIMDWGCTDLIYLPVYPEVRGGADPEILQQAIQKLGELVREKQPSSIALPLIEAGGLPEGHQTIRILLEEVLGDFDESCAVYVVVPSGDSDLADPDGQVRIDLEALLLMKMKAALGPLFSMHTLQCTSFLLSRRLHRPLFGFKKKGAIHSGRIDILCAQIRRFQKENSLKQTAEVYDALLARRYSAALIRSMEFFIPAIQQTASLVIELEQEGLLNELCKLIRFLEQKTERRSYFTAQEIAAWTLGLSSDPENENPKNLEEETEIDEIEMQTWEIMPLLEILIESGWLEEMDGELSWSHTQNSF